jgi:hypothetical protein
MQQRDSADISAVRDTLDSAEARFAVRTRRLATLATGAGIHPRDILGEGADALCVALAGIIEELVRNPDDSTPIARRFASCSLGVAIATLAAAVAGHATLDAALDELIDAEAAYLAAAQRYLDAVGAAPTPIIPEVTCGMRAL